MSPGLSVCDRKLVDLTRFCRGHHAPNSFQEDRRQPGHGRWRLQDAKAQFSELVRRARQTGPQRVTVHGKDAVVVVDAEEWDRLQEARVGSRSRRSTGQFAAEGCSIERLSVKSPVRDVKL